MAGQRGLMVLVTCGLLVGLMSCTPEGAEEKSEMAVFVKTTELTRVAFLGRQGPYEEIPQALKELHKWTEENGHTPVGPPWGTFFDDPSKVPPEELKWEVAQGIAEDVKEVRPGAEGGVGVKVMPPTRVAATYHKGSYAKVSETYKGLFAWVFRNNYQVTGPAREIWWSDSQKTAEADLLTEIQVPIRKK